jgi:hypothetical protein
MSAGLVASASLVDVDDDEEVNDLRRLEPSCHGWQGALDHAGVSVAVVVVAGLVPSAPTENCRTTGLGNLPPAPAACGAER